jgi:ABC-2 type transport system permease protein
MSATLPRLAHERPRPNGFAVFWALFLRDVRVTQREIVSYLLRTTIQPLLFVVVFGLLLGKMGFMAASYKTTLLPGILAVSLALSSLQSVILPMVADFGWTREIDDRLLAPAAMEIVVLEKIVAAVLQGIIATLFVLPMTRLIMGPIPGLTLTHYGEIAMVTVLGAAAFSTMGLVLGTAVQPQQIGLMFSLILTPMIFFGCAYYPWRGLEVVPALQYGVLVNPLVYVAEGMRAVVTPDSPHMPLPIVLATLAAMTLVFWFVGLRSFAKRAIG